MNNKYLIKIEYEGTNFAGWQYQKNALSIQEILQKAISKYLKHKTIVIGSGRTDSGVHAKEQSANICLDTSMNPYQIKSALNRKLPDDIY